MAVDNLKLTDAVSIQVTNRGLEGATGRTQTSGQGQIRGRYIRGPRTGIKDSRGIESDRPAVGNNSSSAQSNVATRDREVGAAGDAKVDA